MHTHALCLSLTHTCTYTCMHAWIHRYIHTEVYPSVCIHVHQYREGAGDRQECGSRKRHKRLELTPFAISTDPQGDRETQRQRDRRAERQTWRRECRWEERRVKVAIAAILPSSQYLFNTRKRGIVLKKRRHMDKEKGAKNIFRICIYIYIYIWRGRV